ncbi:FG-GAP repeat protein [Thalassoglobus neptunius]|uniref:FG-GAP repeat protein n=1 Tax=Thalassoglobus neptunius TaxID=1938619 RepID=A0A5C5WYH6_9PLAN|nr:VCBS repeat-containing protein [Thalassoglobus neptunius]TWT55746.1 FG-GAP repeat protein [Thalassoglobus neptunius]
MSNSLNALLFASVSLLTCAPSALLKADDDIVEFQEVVLDPEIGKVCYAVTLADVDNDGLQDIVAVTERRVLWFQAPDWTPRVIIADQTPLDNVCIAPHDIDGDGLVDFALGAGWTKIGTIHWLTRGDSLDEPWKVHLIGEERWTHRMRWADVLGTGSPQLVVSPLNATVGNGVRLTAFEVPDNPVEGGWSATVLDQELNRMHNHWHVDVNDDDSIDTLTASQEGVYLIERTPEGWAKTQIGDGIDGVKPFDRGAGEVKLGRLASGVDVIATVEPMHGHSLVVYTEPKGDQKLWTRTVIDAGFQRGHALWMADLDGDGNDEIVFGHSDTPETFGVIVYKARNAWGTNWSKHVVDAGGMACEDLIVEDLTGDGFPDIVAGGRATHNLKLYINRGP